MHCDLCFSAAYLSNVTIPTINEQSGSMTNEKPVGIPCKKLKYCPQMTIAITRIDDFGSPFPHERNPYINRASYLPTSYNISPSPTMSNTNTPPPLIYLSDSPGTPTASEHSPPPTYTPLYQSLQAAVQHPSCVSPAWIDTLADFKNNPRALHKPPHNDGSLHWVNKKGNLLCMAFPAVLDLNGKYGRIGPYFSLFTDQGIKVHFLLYSFNHSLRSPNRNPPSTVWEK